MMRNTPVVTINFARTDFRLLSAVRRWLLVLAAASAVVLLALVLSARSYRAQGDEAERQVRELAATEEKLRPVMEERQQLVNNLNTMTGLVQARRFSWTRFLTRLEEVFPEGIALTRLELQPRELTAKLEGFAHSPEALSRLMIGLQQSRSFKNPLLKKQSMDKGILSFNVIVLYYEDLADGASSGPAGKRVR
jgi:Tfp pilus assembly protein PilN